MSLDSDGRSTESDADSGSVKFDGASLAERNQFRGDMLRKSTLSDSMSPISHPKRLSEGSAASPYSESNVIGARSTASDH